MSWLRGWGVWDDEALTALTSKGLVRRALKSVADATITLEDEAATVSTAGFTVTIGPRGPQEARCPCPATGVCQHIVTAAMVARDKASETLEQPSALDPLEALLSISPRQWCTEAGASATRQAMRQPTAEAQLLSAEGRLEILIPGLPVARFAPGQGLAGITSEAPKDQWPALHLAAVARAFTAAGIPWAWPTRFVEELAHEEARQHPVELIEEASAALTSIVEAGLSGVGPGGIARLERIRVQLRAAQLLRPAGLIGEIVGQLHALDDRNDLISEADTLQAMARCWSLLLALPEAGWPPRLTGRRDEQAVDTLQAIALGATWWARDSGARGATIHLWDTANGRWVTSTIGRAAGQDPAFQRSLTTQLWQVPIATLLGAHFTLDEARVRPDGSLAPTSRTRVLPASPCTHDELAAISAAPRSDTVVDPFGPIHHATWLIRSARSGELTLDEAGQSLRWQVAAADGTEIELTIPINRHTRPRAERLQDLLSHGPDPEFVLAVSVQHLQGLIWTPIAVAFTQREALRLVNLDFEAAVAPSKNNNWLRRRIALLSDQRQPDVVRSPVARLAQAALDLALDTASRGVQFTPTDRAKALALTAEHLSLGTLSRGLHHLADSPSAENLLRVTQVSLLMRDLSQLQN